MSDLKALAERGDVLKPFGELDVLLLYALVSSELGAFLGDREIASRVWLRERTLLNRGSYLPPLHVGEVAGISSDLLETRSRMSLPDAKGSLSPVEAKVWRYFPPRKLCDYFYATNHEKQGRDIDRIFYDIDRPEDMPHEAARQITNLFVEAVLEDDEFLQLAYDKPLVAWTGSSFHVYFFLKKKQKHDFYTKNIQFSEKGPETGFTAKWLQYVRGKTRVKVIAGHEKKLGAITIDPSQTPSGKLARSPLGSLHMSNYQTVDGVSVPVDASTLNDQELTKSLKLYTPNRVVGEIPSYRPMLSLIELGGP
jgi:hypothetical protein